LKIATRPVDTGSTAPPTVRSSLAYCDALARNAGANFYWGFHLLASEERLAMSALYAFARTTDDIVDEGTSSIAERDVQLERWRGELLAALNGVSSSSRILIAVADCARRFQLPVDELLALVDGCAQDLHKTRYETMDETLDYCRKVAGTVGLNMLAILGAKHPVAERAMLDLATAFQLTNILRDVPEDARRDRIYLPLDELKTHGVAEHEVLSGGSDALRRYMRQVGAQAKDRYRLSGAMSPHLAPRAANALTVMRCIYEGILDQILWRDCDVWSRRPKLSALRKARILLPVLFNSGLGNLISG